jgi:hypothetical protein
MMSCFECLHFLFYMEEILLEDLQMSPRTPSLGRSQDVYIFGLCMKIINAVRDTCVTAFRRLGYMFAVVCCNSTYCARFQNVSFLEISD